MPESPTAVAAPTLANPSTGSVGIVFRYRAVEQATGRIREGEQIGANAYEVRAALRRVGLTVEAIRAVDDTGRLPWLMAPLRRAWQARQRRRHRVARADLADALATMIEAGMPLESAVGALADSAVRSVAERRMLARIREELRSGQQLDYAITHHPAWFDALDVAMLKAGQKSGDLTSVLRAISEHHQRGSALGHKLFTALAYPVFLAVIALAVVVFLSTFTLPQVLEMLVSSRQEPPSITVAVVGIGQFVVHSWWLVVSSAIVLAMVIRSLYRRLDPQSRLGRWLSANPIARARRRSRVAQLALTLGRLQRAGLPLTDALLAAAEVADSPALSALLVRAAEAIRGGRDLSSVIAESGLLDGEFAQLVHLGEESGELAGMLERVAERYERSALRAMDRLTALLEPAAILILAGLIGVVVFAAITPLLRLAKMG